MRGAWWKIARLELTLAMRDRESLIWSLVAPIAMAWMFGSMFGSEGPPAPTRVAIDDGIRVELPDSLLERLQSGRETGVRVIQGDADAIRARAVSARMREFLYYATFHLPELEAQAAENVGSFSSPPPAVLLRTQPLGAAPKIVSGKERTLPAMLIMYIMFQVMTFFLSLWVDDLRTGKIKRIVMSPTTSRDLLLGEIAARLVWASLQVVIILGLGSLVMGVRLDVNWLNFGLVLLAFMLAAASIGMMAGSFFRSSEKAGAMGVIISLVLAALGGCWWPLEIVPGAMRAVALALPTGQAMSAIGEMLALGPGAPFPYLNIVILLMMAFIALPVAARRMRAQLVQ
jgi:ABC-type multidrug transport system permease subunit